MTQVRGEIKHFNICSVSEIVYMTMKQQSCHYARSERHPLCFDSSRDFLRVILGSHLAPGVTFQ